MVGQFFQSSWRRLRELANPSSGDRPQSASPTAEAEVPEQNLGIILQRGGEQFILEKVSDRFVAAPRTPDSADWTNEIPGRQRLALPRSQMVEFLASDTELDKAMQVARANKRIAFASHVYRLKNNPETPVYLTNQITIQFAADLSQSDRITLTTLEGLQEVKQIPGIPNAFVFQVTNQATQNPLKIANRLATENAVLAAEPNILIPAQKFYRPSDSLYSKQWYLYHKGGRDLAEGAHIDIEKAWDITRGIRPIVIAVADDSVDLNHPDFQGLGKIAAPMDFKERDFLPQPGTAEDNHGTACAGICVAEESGRGIVGVAPGCTLMPLRTTGYLDDQSIEELFDWAIDKGAAVISCSWGPAAVNFPLSIRQNGAIARAATRGRNGQGCVIVFAAGNANRPIDGIINETDWPGNVLRGYTKWLAGFAVHPNVIAVSASTSLNKKALYSNWGKNISVCAPSNNAPGGMWLQETGFIETPPQINIYTAGLGVFTADRTGYSGYSSDDFTGDFGGTSSACPVVAGVAALVLSVNPDLTASEVKRILEETADKIVDPDSDPQLGFRKGTYDASGHSEWFGYGKVNAYQAVKAAQRKLSAPLRASRQFQVKNNARLSIPNYNPHGVTSTISVSETGSLKDIEVSVDIEHDFLGDLQVSLIGPSGAIVLLQNRTLGRRTVLQATYSIETRPMLKQFLNRPVRGVWRLQVVDFAIGENGRLNGWELKLGV